MKVFKENSIKNPLYITTLDNGVILFVYDGYAEDTNGKKYYPVTKKNKDGEYEFIGWKV